MFTTISNISATVISTISTTLGLTDPSIVGAGLEHYILVVGITLTTLGVALYIKDKLTGMVSAS